MTQERDVVKITISFKNDRGKIYTKEFFNFYSKEVFQKKKLLVQKQKVSKTGVIMIHSARPTVSPVVNIA